MLLHIKNKWIIVLGKNKNGRNEVPAIKGFSEMI